jgi:hypothetical protein
MDWVKSEPLEISVTGDETVALEATSSNPLLAFFHQSFKVRVKE